jgi:hypothetical protein
MLKELIKKVKKSFNNTFDEMTPEMFEELLRPKNMW